MTDTVRNRFGKYIARYSRAIIALALVVTLVLGVGATALGGDLTLAEFEVETDAAEKAEAVEERFGVDRDAVTIIALHDGVVLTGASLSETIDLQQAIRENATVAPTLVDDTPTADTATAFVETYLRSQGSFHALSLEDKARTLGTFTDEELADEIPRIHDEESPMVGGHTPASAMLPVDYDGETVADARLVLVFHDVDGNGSLQSAQTAIEELTAEHVTSTDHFVFGETLLEDRAAASTAATFSVIGPLALLLVIGLLALALRDPIDIGIAVTGALLVVVWTAGIAGWVGLEPSQLMVAIPLLLLGLSIDYGLHMLRRHRAARDTDDSNAVRLLATGAGGVLLAIFVTSITTATGFLTGALSPLSAVREFGLAAAIGILVAFLVFGFVVPAVRYEADFRFGGRTSRLDVLPPLPGIPSVVLIPTKRTSLTVIIIAMLLATGGVVGATGLDTTVERGDFYPTENPGWVTADELVIGEQYEFLTDRFELVGGTDRIDIVVSGDLTDPTASAALVSLEAELHEATTIRSDTENAFVSPLSIADRYAPFDSELEAALAENDLETGFDRTGELAGGTFKRFVTKDDEGTYDSVRVTVLTEGGIDAASVSDEFEAIADGIATEHPVEMSVSGGPIVTASTQEAVLETLLWSFMATLLVTGIALLALFRRLFGRAVLGLVVLVPVVLALAWVLGAMRVLGLSLNAETAIITGIAIGLGVDYAIHVAVRFYDERTDVNFDEAVSAAVTDTGTTLVLSAATTGAAVGVFLLSAVPSLRRLGLLLVVVVAAALLAAIVVLPNLLVIGHRWRR